jgi:prophage tail gpP-like protein
MILKVNGQIIDKFNSFRLDLRYDSVASAFSFNFYFSEDSQEIKNLFRPGEYQRAVVEHNDEVLITGTLLSSAFGSGPSKSLTGIGGYSLPGVLEDCEIPVELYPLQSDGLTIKQIAQRLIKPFGLHMIVDSEVAQVMNTVLTVSTANERQSIKSYLTEITAQHNIVMSHDNLGRLVFTRAKTKQAAIADFAGGIPGLDMSLSFDGQQMHSKITVQKQADMDGGNASEYTITNPFAKAYRPKVISQSSGTDISASQAARNALSEELKNIKIVINIDRWDINKKLIKPNSIVTVHNHDLYLYKKTRLFVEAVSYVGDTEKQTAELQCVLPCVYDGSTPINIFNEFNKGHIQLH